MGNAKMIGTAAVIALAVAGCATCGRAQERTQPMNNAEALQNGSGEVGQKNLKADGLQLVSKGLQILAEGSRFPVSEAFVFVVNDGETYSALREIGGNLPPLDADFFKSNTVIAAFLGQRPTPGYSVVFAETENGSVRVGEQRPPADAILAQVLTSPYAIAAIGRTGVRQPELLLGESWRKAGRAYRVTSGDILSEGKTTANALGGSVTVLRRGRLATLVLDVKRADGAQVLSNVVSVVLQPQGAFKSRSISGKASASRDEVDFEGQLDEGKKLTLKFRLPATVPGASTASGKLEATAQ